MVTVKAGSPVVTWGIKEMSKSFKLAGLAAVSMIALTNAATAGGFALREQSVSGLGNAFAGAAAGGAGLGSMFWNPATMTNFAGIQTSLGLFAIMPVSKITPTSGTSSLLQQSNGLTSSGDMAQDAVLPSGYASWQVTDSLWLGMSMNTPYGLVTQNPHNWAGQVFGRTSKVKSIEVASTAAYQLNNWISVGAGLRFINFGVRLTSANASGTTSGIPNTFLSGASSAELKGDDTAFGFTLGATIKPWTGGEIGLGYRSQIKPKLEGFMVTPGGISASSLSDGVSASTSPFDIYSNMILPEQVTLGLRQQLTNDLTLLAGFEWTHWGKFSRFPIYKVSDGSKANTLVFDYRNSWYASLGAEYAWNKNWTLRTGVGFEHAPINNDNRSVRLPDSDRTWASLGATYKLDDRMSFDASYAHLFAKSGTITSTVTGTSYTLYANTKGRVDIFALGVNFKLGDEPKKTNKAMITK
jgi:long-chain fatty acid transport protein